MSFITMASWISGRDLFGGTLNTAPPGMLANQYGRTSFLFAGIPGMQLPVPFYKDPSSASGLSIYEQVHNASIFSLYLPIANEADVKNAFLGRNYTDIEFLPYVAHDQPYGVGSMGIRGRHQRKGVVARRIPDAENVRGVWQRNRMFPTRTFAAAFDPATAPAPFHNNTCDGCHVRNGSGIPINTTGTLDPELQAPKEFMTAAAYNPYAGQGLYLHGANTPHEAGLF